MVPNNPGWVVGVAIPVGLLKFNVGWAPNRFEEFVVGTVAVEPNWNPSVIGCELWNALPPKVAWVCGVGILNVIFPVPNAGGAVVLK